MTKKIIVEISEGLGNQLFMYAHAYSLSRKLGYDLFIDNNFETSFTFAPVISQRADIEFIELIL